MNRTTIMSLGTLCLAGANFARAVDYPGAPPGASRATCSATEATLENDAISVRWTFADGGLKPDRLSHRQSSTGLPLEGSECFRLVLGQTPDPRTRTLNASEMKLVARPEIKRIEPQSRAVRLADRLGGWELSARLSSTAPRFEVRWRAILRNGANYVRQELSIVVEDEPLELDELILLELAAPGAETVGSVDGSPVVAGDMFFAVEHPASKSRILEPEATGGKETRFRCSYPGTALLPESETPVFSSVIGVVPSGQLRRGFLYYLERERAQPYRPFLHYNNGSEIGCEYWQRQRHKTPEEAARFRGDQQRIWLANIDAFGRELVERRQVVMDSFAHDFEWDDQNVVWRFHEGYFHGFAPAQRTAAKYRSRVGVWYSPAGGYPGKSARLEHGREQGLETNPRGLSLAGPRYYVRIRQACVNMVRRYGVNYFKFDGFGAGNNQSGPGPYLSDVEALLRLIAELRAADARVFVNPSTGSWPSPFWLRYADSIWRQGSDTNVQGKGSVRQRWITYRDSEVYHATLQRAPLYPISSLMIHGIYINHLCLFGNPYDPSSPKPTYETGDLVDEIRSFFGTGTNLQELYIAPDLMTPAAWDTLAEAANWSRANADVLADTHWIGGDPAKDEVYGWASWCERKGILSLRNPSDRAATVAIDVAEAFELPAGAAQTYSLTSPWKEDATAAPIRLTAGRPHAFKLEPFQVLMYDATPER